MPVAASPLIDLLICLRFCTRLPVPALAREAAPFALAEFPRAIWMLPVAGGVVGSISAAVLAISLVLGFPAGLAAPLAIAALVVSTGALHEDGLADCADGFGGGKTRERKLEIMRDSAIGTYGALALALTLYLRVASLTLIAMKGEVLACAVLVAAAALSRAAALGPLVFLPSARGDGSGFSAGRPAPRSFGLALAQGVVFALVPCLAGAEPMQVVLAIAAVTGAAIGVSALAQRQIGGQTGDVAGATQQLSELAVLLVHAAG